MRIEQNKFQINFLSLLILITVILIYIVMVNESGRYSLPQCMVESYLFHNSWEKTDVKGFFVNISHFSGFTSQYTITIYSDNHINYYIKRVCQTANKQKSRQNKNMTKPRQKQKQNKKSHGG